MMTNWNRCCFFVLALAFAAVFAAFGDELAPPERNPDRETLPESSAVINAQATEFSLTLDKMEVAAGRTTFVVENRGSAAHHFVIRGNGLEETTAEIEPGASATLTVDLEPGSYSYLCTVGSHDLLGMRGTLTVTAG
jgi:plastocyanin